jgi:hypothetical protein
VFRGGPGLSRGHVSDDAHDERQKLESMFAKVWIRLGLVILAAGGMVGLLAYGFMRDARYIPSPLIASLVTSFTLTLFDERSIRLEDFRGKAGLLCLMFFGPGEFAAVWPRRCFHAIEGIYCRTKRNLEGPLRRGE